MSLMYKYGCLASCFGCNCSDDEEIHHIYIRRSRRGFGFSIRGGAEYNSPLCVLRIADGGAAQVDRRLRVSCLYSQPCFNIIATYVGR